MQFRAYPDRAALMTGLTGVVAGELAVALAQDGKATLSVPGGTTPGPVFDALSRVDIDWARVAVVLNDERWVPEDSPRSNTRVLRERLLVGRAAAATLIPLYAPVPQPEAALAALGAGLAAHLPITVLILGMGTDLHTASLFPGADRLAEALDAAAPPLLPMRAEAAGEPRITLTAPVLQAARHIHILITGAEKRALIAGALHKPVAEAPIRVILDLANVHWAE